jgi:farnesyl diphosphate synthase
METRMRAYQTRVYSVLDSILPDADRVPRRLHAAQRYAVLGDGKRLRPLLVYFTGEALELPEVALDAPAAAVELIHAYSLVHDDLPAMDNDDVRRGRPSTHRAFDEATAILAGDALQVLAFSLLAGDRTPAVSPTARLNMIRILADASGTEGMAGGQAIDLAAVGGSLSLSELEAMHALKTGALIRASVMMAAACAPHLSRACWDALDGYAQDVGLAFQIQDDILDGADPCRELAVDAARIKPSYTRVMGTQAAKLRTRELTKRACGRLDVLGPRALVLCWLASFVIERPA